MKMNFYYNVNENVCAEESWVIEYILSNEEDVHDWEEVYNGLHTCREYYGWIDCEVSNTIMEKMEGYR
jgi:hypothetical protein